MRDYKIEWDVRLWTYVLKYKDVTIPLNVSSIEKAETLSRFKLFALRRDKNGSNSNIGI